MDFEQYSTKRWLSAIGPAIGAGVGTGILWWFVNGMWTINGVGWLARQGWPLNNVFLMAAGGAAVGFLGGLVACARQRQRAQALASLGRQWGFRYDAAVRPGDFPAMPLFEHWSHGGNRLSGEVQGVPVEIFDLTLVQKSGDSDETTHQTVFLLPAEGLPDFDLGRRGAVGGLLRMAGFRGLTFDAKAVRDSVGSVEVQLFNGNFIVTAGEEPTVRTLFSPTVMKQLNRFPGWSIQSIGGQLALWQEVGLRLQPVSAYRDRLSEALEIRAALLDGATRADSSDAVPGVSEDVLRKEGVGVGMGALGGCLGLFLGFFGGFFVFVALHMGTNLKHEPFRFTSVVFFGSIFGGAALGAGLGAILARWVGKKIGSRWRGVPWLRSTGTATRSPPR